MLANLVGAFIAIIVGATLAPTIADEVHTAKGWNGSAISGNASSAAQSILGLVTLFYTLGIASIAIGAAVMGLRKGGLM